MQKKKGSILNEIGKEKNWRGYKNREIKSNDDALDILNNFFINLGKVSKNESIIKDASNKGN